MIKSKFNCEKGLTLIELLMAIVILGLFITIAWTMIFNSFRIFRESTTQFDINQQAQIILQDTLKTTRPANHIEPGKSGNNSFTIDDNEFRWIIDQGELLLEENVGEDQWQEKQNVNRAMDINVIEFKLKKLENNNFKIVIEFSQENQQIVKSSVFQHRN